MCDVLDVNKLAHVLLLSTHSTFVHSSHSAGIPQASNIQARSLPQHLSKFDANRHISKQHAGKPMRLNCCQMAALVLSLIWTETQLACSDITVDLPQGSHAEMARIGAKDPRLLPDQEIC